MSDEAAVKDQDVPAGDQPAAAQITETPQPEQVVAQSETPETPEGETHPLEPNGDRFKQVWARAKHAEAERERLREEVQKEREERIRLEERLNAKTTQASTQAEYTWDQLEAAIDAGTITRAWANTYRETLVAKKAKQEALAEIDTKQKVESRESSVLSEIERYKRAAPEVMDHTSPARQKVEREYGYMVNTLGFPAGHATQLAALRATLGDADTVERTAKAKQSTVKEPFMETHSSSQKPQQKTGKLIDKLDERQKAHYSKMIASGRYADWNEVEDELKWTPPTLGARRG